MRAAVTRTAAGLRGLATAAAVAGSPLAGLLNSKRYAQVETGFRATPSPSADDYAALMWSRVRTGRQASVDELLDEMRAKGLALSPGVYNCLFFRARGKEGRGYEELERLWKEMRDTKVTPHVYSLNLYLDAMRKKSFGRDLPPRMVKLYRQAHSELGVVGNERTFSILIEVCAILNDSVTMMELLREMEKSEVRITFPQAKRVLDVALVRSAVPLAAIGKDLVTASGGELDEGTLMALGALWASRGLYLNLLGLEKELADRFPESQPSEAFYRLLAHALTRPPPRRVPEETNWTEVFACLDRMMDRGLPIDTKLLLRRLTLPMRTVENLDRAFYALEERRTNQQAVPLAFLNLIIRGCAKARDLDRAFATFAEIPAFDLRPDLSSYTELLGACCQCRDGDAAAHVQNQMDEAGIVPDELCRRYLITVFVNQKHFRRAADLMNGDYSRFAPETLHSLLHFLVRDGDVERAAAMHSDISNTLSEFRLAPHLQDAFDGDSDEGLVSNRD